MLYDGKTYAQAVDLLRPVWEMKQLIEMRVNVPAPEQRLLFNGMALEDHTLCGTYGLSRGTHANAPCLSTMTDLCGVGCLGVGDRRCDRGGRAKAALLLSIAADVAGMRVFVSVCLCER